MKLSEYKDEAALDLLADLIEPATEILGDPEVKTALTSGTRAAAIAKIIKLHKKAVISVLAALDGVPVEEYHCGVLTLPAKLLEIINDPEIMRLFSSAGQTVDQTASGSLTESTKGGEQ